MTTIDSTAVTRNAERRSCEAATGGTGVTGFMDYQEITEFVVLTPTEVAPSCEGPGVGRALEDDPARWPQHGAGGHARQRSRA